MTFVLDIGRVRSMKGSHESYHLSAEEFDFLSDEWVLNSPMVIDVEISHQGKFLDMQGQVRTEVKAICSRCLEPVVLLVECTIQEQLLYVHDTQQYEHLAVGELEELYFIYENDTLDITDIVREAVLAELPQKVVCSEDCQGLCPKCGKNLNHGSCNCDLHEIDPRLAILAKLNDVEEV